MNRILKNGQWWEELYRAGTNVHAGNWPRHEKWQYNTHTVFHEDEWRALSENLQNSQEGGG